MKRSSKSRQPDALFRGAWLVEWSQTNGQFKRRDRSIYYFGNSSFTRVSYDIPVLLTKSNYVIRPRSDYYEIDVYSSNSEWSEPISVGIVKVDEDKLTICCRVMGKRPDEFSTEFGDFRDLKMLRLLPDVEERDLQAALEREFGPVPDEKDPWQHVNRFDREARDKVIDDIFIPIIDRATRPGGNEALYKTLTDRERVIFLTCYSIMAIEDDGFYSFFSWPIGNYWEDVVWCFEEIGATVTAAIVREAASNFPNKQPATTAQEREEQIDAISLDKGFPFDGLYERFADSEEDVYQLALDYWIKHTD